MRRQHRIVISLAVVVMSFLVAGHMMAGNLDPTNAPGPTMHTLEEIYQKVQNLAPQTLQSLTSTTAVVNAGYYAATNLTQVDTNLATANIKAGTTIFGVVGKTEVVDTTSGDAVSGDMLAGKKAWVGGSEVTGDVAAGVNLDGVDGSLVTTITDGLYIGSKTATASDTDLAAGNVRSGVSIFDVQGKTEVVDTTTGDAGASDLLAGKRAYVDGVEVTGTIATVTLSDTTNTVTAGYYAATNLIQVDADLATGNIKAGVSIFGVNGSSAVVDTSTGNAVAGDMLSGKTAYVNGALVTGDVAAGVNLSGSDGSLAITITNGLYTGFKTATANDTDLVTDNIRSGVSIFDVQGKTEVVDTTTGDAIAGDMLVGKKAWVDGTEVTGTAPAAAVPKTGARDLPSYAEVAGEDGDASMRKGVAWPPQRFTDNGNGTVTDNLTGLIWLKNANVFGARTWATALTDCSTLNSGEGGLTDGSVEGDWRLPNAKELYSLIDIGRVSPALPSGHPFTDVQLNFYWSSSTRAGNTGDAWDIHLHHGMVYLDIKTVMYYVWPVRGGQ